MTEAAIETPEAKALRIKIALQSGPRIMPSRREPWAGTKVDGSRWTAEQLATLKADGKDPDRVWTHQVRLWGESDAFGVPDRIYRLCPALAKSRGRIKIIAPDGTKVWTDAA